MSLISEACGFLYPTSIQTSVPEKKLRWHYPDWRPMMWYLSLHPNYDGIYDRKFQWLRRKGERIVMVGEVPAFRSSRQRWNLILSFLHGLYVCLLCQLTRNSKYQSFIAFSSHQRFWNARCGLSMYSHARIFGTDEGRRFRRSVVVKDAEMSHTLFYTCYFACQTSRETTWNNTNKFICIGVLLSSINVIWISSLLRLITAIFSAMLRGREPVLGVQLSSKWDMTAAKMHTRDSAAISCTIRSPNSEAKKKGNERADGDNWPVGCSESVDATGAITKQRIMDMGLDVS